MNTVIWRLLQPIEFTVVIASVKQPKKDGRLEFCYDKSDFTICIHNTIMKMVQSVLRIKPTKLPNIDFHANIQLHATTK